VSEQPTHDSAAPNGVRLSIDRGIELTDICPLASELARRLREARDDLTRRWLDRIAERVALVPNRVFPSQDLLDHVPLLLVGVADYLENPSDSVTADAPVIAKAMELGALRHSQGFDESEIHKEFEILGSILLHFLSTIADSIDEECSRAELLLCAQRVFRAVSLIQQAAATQFLQLVKQQLAEREERLRAFNRALTHEFRNKIGAAIGGAQLLDLPGLTGAERERLVGIVVRNLGGMRSALENLLELSRLTGDARQQRNVHMPAAAAEAVRLLRDLAEANGVEIRIAEDLPDVEVSAAAVELVLSNLVGNALKYSDPAKTSRWVEIRGRVLADATGEPMELVIEVADNGIGVPVAERERIFERFFRANGAASEVDGSGLGLTIVQDVVTALGGRVWVEFPTDEGSVFAFSLPARRARDAQSVD
jgi:signal transduction histidine kinase